MSVNSLVPSSSAGPTTGGAVATPSPTPEPVVVDANGTTKKGKEC